MNGGRTALVMLGLLAGGIAAAMLIRHHDHTTSLATSASRIAPSSPTAMTGSPAGAAGTVRQRTSLARVIRGFATAYAHYLDGGSISALRRYGSITATAEATGDGRIPVAFRDGILTLASTSAFARTCCSAQETVVLTDRSEDYPLTVDLLYEQNRWQVSNLIPVDLSIDRHLPESEGVDTPADANTAARQFATSYVRFRAGEGAVPTGLTAVARNQITQGSDSLVGTGLPHQHVRIVSIAYGPPTGSEFAATATVTDGLMRETFSFLMTHTRAGWVCGAFL